MGQWQGSSREAANPAITSMDTWGGKYPFDGRSIKSLITTIKVNLVP